MGPSVQIGKVVVKNDVIGGVWAARETWLVIGAWVLLWTLTLLFPIASYDIWWQIDSGRWMLENGHVLRQEIRSIGDGGTPWTNFTWLFQVLVAAIYGVGGFWGLLGLKGFLWCLLLLASAAASVQSRTAVLPWLVVTLGVASTMTGFMYLRPHLLAGICLLAAVVLLHQSVNRRTLLGWGLLLAIWANVHASVVVGGVAMGLHLLLLPGRGGLRPRPARNLMLAMLLGCTAFLTPNGLDLVRVLLDHAGSEIVQRYISEWQEEDFPPATRLVVVLGFFGLLRHWRRISWGEVFLLVFFAYMATKNVRFLFELSLISIRPAVAILTDGWQALAAQGVWQRRLFALVALCGVFIVAEIPDSFSSRKAAVFPVDQSKYPMTTAGMAIAVADHLGRPVRLFNLYGLGGFLQWAGNGKISTFIDGRTPTIYPEARLMEHMLGFAQPGVIEMLDQRYGFDALVSSRDAAQNKQLDSEKWRMVGFDEATAFYLKVPLAKALGWPAITFDPSKLDMPDNVSELTERIAVLRSLLYWDQANFLAQVHLGLALLKRAALLDDDPAEGIAALEEAVSLRPHHAVANFLLGRALWQTGVDKERAMECFEIALAGRGGGLQSQRLAELANIYLAARQPSKALEVLDSVQVKARALDKSYATWLTRATAEAALGRPEKAGQSLYFAKLIANAQGEDICDAVVAIEKLVPEPARQQAAIPCRPIPAYPVDNAAPGN